MTTSIPTQNITILPRPQLSKKLDQGLKGKVTLVSAPAGFGKTTLVSSFFKTKVDISVAWLSLGYSDDEIMKFLSQLSDSLQSISPKLGKSIKSLLSLKELPATRMIVKALTNEISSIHSEKSALVLDDYQNITSTDIHDFISEFIEYAPDYVHLVIISREDPPIPLARLRVSHQLNEIRASDLRFSKEETSTFLAQNTRVDLSEDEISLLQQRTEGWIAGLQMAALSLQARENRDDFLRDFATSDRFIFDYLIEEVLERQTPEVQDFLLHTSILDQLYAPLCDAVRGRDNSQEILLVLEKSNLFLTRLGAQSKWYRYHQLFADLLRQQLTIRQPALVEKLHHRAIQWHRDNHSPGDALEHALVINNKEKILELVDELFWGGVESPQLFQIRHWLNKQAEETLLLNPWLNVIYARILIRERKIKQAEKKLQKAQEGITNCQLPEEKKCQIKSHIAVLQAHIAKLNGEIDQVIILTHQSLEWLPAWETRLRSAVLSLMGTALQRVGHFDEAIKALEESVSYSKAIDDSENALETLGNLAGSFVERGDLYRAFSICEDAQEIMDNHFAETGRHLFGAGYIHFRLSTILRHWNDLNGSLTHARRSVALNQYWGYENRLAFINLSIASQAVGDQKGAFQAIQQAELLAAKESKFWVEDVQAIRALLHLQKGNLKAASQWVRETGLTASDEIPFEKQRVYLTLAHVYLAQGQAGDCHALEKALQVLNRLEALFDPASAKAYLLQVFILQTLVYFAQQRPDFGKETLEKALYIGEQGGYIRVFVSGGEPMRRVLEDAVRNNLYLTYVQELLSAFDQTASKSSRLLENLTAREQYILELMATDLSLPEIASQLVISVSTARTHVKRIYSKLDVHSRFEAVTKAKELHLL